MLFDEVLRPNGLIEGNYVIVHREAVRAIIFKDSRILMVQSNKGDFKLPGGGIEENENHTDAIIREVREETGYIVTKVSDKVGQVLEHKIDLYDASKVFEMHSHYYLCSIDENVQYKLQLSHSEEKNGLKPLWVSINTALNKNSELLNKNEVGKNSWLKRELLVLKILKSHFN